MVEREAEARQAPKSVAKLPEDWGVVLASLVPAVAR